MSVENDKKNSEEKSISYDKSFEGFIGNNAIVMHLKEAMKHDKVSHAYIINGEDKSGKTLLALEFAKALMCVDENERPCGHCKSCIQADSHNNPDIIWITHEKPNTITVDDVREQIVNDAQIKPYAGRYKIYIINEAEKMNVQAQNAILKTIEEPPHYVIVILITNNAGAFLQTITSRCVMLSMKPVREDIIREYIMKKYQIPDYKENL